MNYIFYFKQNLSIYLHFVLTSIITYSIMLYFGWAKPIIVTPEHIIAFVSGTVSCIFLYPLLQSWFDSPNKQ